MTAEASSSVSLTGAEESRDVSLVAARHYLPGFIHAPSWTAMVMAWVIYGA
jgi:hypothetical protein